jgi:hypothetical protein
MESLNTIEYSLGGNGSDAGSPEPFYEEDRVLLSEELGSIQGSRHSLYPATVEHQPLATCFGLSSQISPRSIPLADLNGELQLSSMSLTSSKSLQSIKSYGSSVKVLLTFYRNKAIQASLLFTC